ncbi:MAG TPA: hypothetical protein VFZ73_10660, partial [Gemmatimonadaceae bacterium]
LAQGHERAPVATMGHFAFYDDLATNINDALIQAGDARRARRPELFQAGNDSACFSKLAPSARSAWNQAVDYYAEIISPADWLARQQYLLRVDLAGFTEEVKDSSARQFTAIARSFRDAASPAYQACRWNAQSAQNRQAIDEIRALLELHGEKITARLERLYRNRWNGPVRADLVETAGWSGANSVGVPRGGAHILVSSRSYRGLPALEIVFHEGSHILMNQTSPVQSAIDSAAVVAGVRMPDGLWHAVLFYITGETVRTVLAEAGNPSYTPLIYEIFGRSPWGAHRTAIEQSWKPYLEGKRTLSQAATEFVTAVRASLRR